MMSPTRSSLNGVPDVAGGRPRAADAAPRLASKNAPSGTRRFQWTLVEMHALGIRNALRKLFFLRHRRGQGFGSPGAWAQVAADITAAIRGPDIRGRDVDGTCTVMGLRLNPGVCEQMAARASNARRSAGPDDLRILAAAAVGHLVELTAEERSTLEITKIDAIDETADQRTKRLSKERKAAARAAAGAVSRSRSKKALAPWKGLGISKSSFYARGLHLGRTDPSGSSQITDIGMKQSKRREVRTN